VAGSSDPQPARAAAEDDALLQAVLFCGQGIAARQLKGHDSRSLLAIAVVRAAIGHDRRPNFR